MKKYTVIIFILLIVFSCSNYDTQSFTDNFNNNKIGWVEEKTKSHDIYISNGYYIIENKDTTTDITSTRYLDKSWHFNLPTSYEINSSFQVSNPKIDTLSCGLILECNSYLYEFTFFNTGKITISGYNYQNEETMYLNNIDSISATNKFDCSLNIKDWDFALTVNDKKVATGELDCKTWDRIVPFTGKLTKSEIDYFKVIKN